MIDIRWVWLFLDTSEDDSVAAEGFWGRVARSSLSSRRGDRDEFATLLPQAGDGWLKAQRVGAAREGDVGGVHLDLDVTGPLTEASAEVIALGGVEVSRAEDVIVMLSPGGFTFCLTAADPDPPRHQVRTGQPDLVDQVCLDVPADAFDAELDFWEQLTGWDRQPSRHREFASLTRPDGIPVRFLLQRLGEADGVTRGHLDLACVDRQATLAAHLRAGAAVLDEHEHWTVLRDPTGRVYCLTDRQP